MSTRRVLTALLTGLVLALTGCGGLPETGPVVQGLPLDAPIRDPLRVFPTPPKVGATQQEIALGFIRAGEDDNERRATARQYLGPASSDSWQWASEDIVIVDSADDLDIRTVRPGTLEVTGVAVARLSPQGRYIDLPADTRVSVTFAMTKVGSEWRIELQEPALGLWLDSAAFERLYTARNVYYVTPTGRQLVPDLRFFPNGSRMATTLARAQLDPPPAHLEGALMTGIPAGTALSVNAVPVENGRALVTLSSVALEADPDERRAMWAQLAATLSQIPSVRTVAINAGGTDLELSDLGSDVSIDELPYDRVSWPSFDTALLRRPDGRMVRLDPGFIPDTDVNRRRPDRKLDPGDPVSITPGWVRLAMSVDGKEVAAVGDNLSDLAWWRGGKFTQIKGFGTDLSSPAYDAKGFLWVGGRVKDSAARLFAMSSDGTTTGQVPRPVETPWLVKRRVVAFAIAADATRILILTSDPDGRDVQLGLAAIVRTPNGVPAKVTEPLRLAQPLTDMVDVVWLDERGYAVLGRMGTKDVVRPWLGDVGAGLSGIRRVGSQRAEDTRVLPIPEGSPIALTAFSTRGLVVVTNRKAVWVRAGAPWHRTDAGLDVLLPGR